MTPKHLLAACALAGAILLGAGCGEKGEDTRGAASAAEPSGATAAPGAEVKPTGKVITIELISDEKGNYFKPNDVEAHRGDVLRFTLTSGVHNVDFLPDSNAGKQGLPPASDVLQLPGQTLDIPVNLAEGHYFFQCDPHAPLGMTGRLEVEDEHEDDHE